MLWGIKSYSMQSWALNVPIKTTWLNSVSNQPRWGASDPNVNSRRRLKANFYSNTNFIFAYLQELLGPPPTDLLRSSVRVRITIGPLQWSVLCGSYNVISLPVVTVFFSSSYPDDNCPDDNCLAFICLSTPIDWFWLSDDEIQNLLFIVSLYWVARFQINRCQSRFFVSTEEQVLAFSVLHFACGIYLAFYCDVWTSYRMFP